MKKENIRIIYISPGKEAEIIEIENTKAAFRKLLKGNYIEYMPFDDSHVLLAEENGKKGRKKLNRAITDSEGRILDVIVGDFLIMRGNFDEQFYESVDPENEEDRRIFERLRFPHRFYLTEEGEIDARKE